MSKKCELTGKIPMKSHNVSHANNKTKRRFLPNLKKVKFTSELMKRSLKLTVSNAGVRSVDKKGSFDEYLKVVKNKNLSPRLKKLKKGILINKFYKLLKGKIKIIGVGGVDSGQAAYDKFIAGADLIQLYTGMVFKGPNIAGIIKKDLKDLLLRDGVKNFTEIIGNKTLS